MGAESYVLDVAGQWRAGLDDIVCVFSRAKDTIIPAFCNKVTASSKLTSVTTAQVETIGGMTVVAEKTDVPAALKYEISVTPDANSASGYADGIVSTTFTVSVMEGRSDGTPVFVPGTPAQPARPPTPAGIGPGTFNACVAAFGGCRNLAELVGVDTASLRVDYIPFNPAAGDSAGAPAEGDRIVVSNGVTGEVYATWTGIQGVTPAWTTTGAAIDATLTGPMAADLNAALTLMYGQNPLAGFIGGIAGLSGSGAASLATLGATGNADFMIRNTNEIWTANPGAPIPADPGSPAIPATEPHFELPGSDELASTLTYIDTATVAGGISTFNKVFAYTSGVACENC